MTRIIFAVGMALLLSRVTIADEATDKAKELLIKASKAADAGESAKAVELTSAAIKQNSSLAIAYYVRGREHFRIGKVDESVVDFDKYVKLQPNLEPRQWERGISYYYAGEFKKGAEQFELYQTYHDNDVENSTWRYLCMARFAGVEKARQTMLPIKNDRRVPMMQIFDMFRGKVKPDDVLEVAKAGEPDAGALNRRLFYAHLYIGLFYEAAGKADLAKKHIGKAANHKIGHYMWDVARVHFDLLNKPKKQ
jgi:lipoprotein NlpI